MRLDRPVGVPVLRLPLPLHGFRITPTGSVVELSVPSRLRGRWESACRHLFGSLVRFAERG